MEESILSKVFSYFRSLLLNVHYCHVRIRFLYNTSKLEENQKHIILDSEEKKNMNECTERFSFFILFRLAVLWY